MYDHRGEQVTAGDVLDDQEQTLLAAHRRQQPRRRTVKRAAVRDPHDELGYVGGTWDPSWVPEEWRS